MNLLDYFKKVPDLKQMCEGSFWHVKGPPSMIARNPSNVVLLQVRERSGKEYLYGPVTVSEAQRLLPPGDSVSGYWDVEPVRIDV